jgi:hypothetical protein
MCLCTFHYAYSTFWRKLCVQDKRHGHKANTKFILWFEDNWFIWFIRLKENDIELGYVYEQKALKEAQSRFMSWKLQT